MALDACISAKYMTILKEIGWSRFEERYMFQNNQL